MQLLLVSLFMFHERDTIRKILSILQAILIPVVGGDALDAHAHNALIMIPSLQYSEVLLQLIFQLLDTQSSDASGGDSGGGGGGDGSGNMVGQQALQTGILPSLSETFYSLLVVCDENNISGVADWLTRKLVLQEASEGQQQQSLFLPSIAPTAPERQVICSTLLRFAHARTARKFKTLITDVHKVCNREMDVAGLRDYCV
jgi:hypothetical protein